MSRADQHEDDEDVGRTDDAAWPRREAARLRQIGIGKARPEYRKYICDVPVEMREPDHPRTPDYRARDVSKRQFDRALGDWRRKLHELAASRENVDAGSDSRGSVSESSKVGKGKRSSSSKTSVASKSNTSEPVDGQWREKSDGTILSIPQQMPHVQQSQHNQPVSEGSDLQAASAGAAVVQIKLADQLPQSGQLNSGQALPMQGSAPPMSDSWPQWAWSDSQDGQMTTWLQPAEEQWFCTDGLGEMPLGWNQPPAPEFASPPEFENFETPQKISHGPGIPDELWTPEPGPWCDAGNCGVSWMMPAEAVEVSFTDVPPLPAGSDSPGERTPRRCVTPDRKKSPSGPCASPAPMVTPQPRATPKVPMSAGGQTLPPTPHGMCSVKKTPSPHRLYVAAPVFPSEVQPPPWTCKMNFP